jgi:hypothetical protein
MRVLANAVSDTSPRWGEVTCGGHTAHADDTHVLTYPPEGKLMVFFIRDKVYYTTNGIQYQNLL